MIPFTSVANIGKRVLVLEIKIVVTLIEMGKLVPRSGDTGACCGIDNILAAWTSLYENLLKYTFMIFTF